MDFRSVRIISRMQLHKVICTSAAAFFLILGAGNARAQTTGNDATFDSGIQSQTAPVSTSGYSIQKGTNEFGLWAGSTSDSPTIIGGAKDRKLPFIMGLRYGRMLFVGKRSALQYTFDLIPAAVVSQPTPDLQRTRVFGAGVFPVGFKLFLRPQKKFKPFVEINSGPVYFTRRVPRPDAARFNFITNLRGGVQILSLKRRAVTIGYDIGHLSNAGISKANPGFNMNYFYLGFSIFK